MINLLLNPNKYSDQVEMTGISVIIPTYNRASFLERTLASVQRQTLACGEIIVVDDGSTDETPAVVDAFARECESRVRYMFQKNAGPASARNRGIREAHFPLIAFLDSDDHWQKKKLQLQFDALMANPDAMISHTKEKWFRRGVHLNQKKIHQPGNGDIFKHCLKLCAVGMSTVMVKKELFDVVGFFNEEFRCCEDYDLWLRVSRKYPFLLIDTPLTIKEGGREDQVSYRYRVGMDRLRIAAIIDLINNGSLSGKQIIWALEELQRKCLVYGIGCRKHKRITQGDRYLSLAKWAEDIMTCDTAVYTPVPDTFINLIQ